MIYGQGAVCSYIPAWGGLARCQRTNRWRLQFVTAYSNLPAAVIVVAWRRPTRLKSRPRKSIAIREQRVHGIWLLTACNSITTHKEKKKKKYVCAFGLCWEKRAMERPCIMRGKLLCLFYLHFLFSIFFSFQIWIWLEIHTHKLKCTSTTPAWDANNVYILYINYLCKCSTYTTYTLFISIVHSNFIIHLCKQPHNYITFGLVYNFNAYLCIYSFVIWLL
jgi:hypothetical protein